MNHPLIGVTSTSQRTPSDSLLFTIGEKYTSALIGAGACPVVIPLDLPEAALFSLLPRLDGVLFTGGGDVHPRHYGDPASTLVHEVDEQRDRVEFTLLQQVLQNGMPFLGICRGLQVINVGLAGTIYEDMSAQNKDLLRHAYYDGFARDYPAHDVRIENGSRLSKILGEAALPVNSLHHQGIWRLADGLVPSAYAPDGLVEGIELPGHPFGLAVQWHPEWLQSQPPMQALFGAFVRAAGQTQRSG